MYFGVNPRSIKRGDQLSLSFSVGSGPFGQARKQAAIFLEYRFSSNKTLPRMIPAILIINTIVIVSWIDLMLFLIIAAFKDDEKY